MMEVYSDMCRSFGLPVWIAAVLHAAKRLHSDHARRKKVYRILQRKLVHHGVGLKDGVQGQPTYVYPKDLKLLIHAAFPENICDYPDPSHSRVVYVTVEDLHNIKLD